MTPDDVIARARGLVGRVLDGATLDEIERATRADALASALGIADASADAIDRIARVRIAADFAILSRWTRVYPDAIAALELDEDRRSLRAIVRGLAASSGADRRLAGTVPTARLPEPLLAALAAAPSIDAIRALLGAHPLAVAFATRSAALEPLAIEAALARAFAEQACRSTADRAMRVYVSQVVDTENASAALLLAARGGGLLAGELFIDGGARLRRERFLAVAGDATSGRELLSRAFAATPLALAIVASSPAALEDAALVWQLGTQARLRRTDPHGLASVIYVVLRRRAEARRLRRAAWRIALGGAR